MGALSPLNAYVCVYVLELVPPKFHVAPVRVILLLPMVVVAELAILKLLRVAPVPTVRAPVPVALKFAPMARVPPVTFTSPAKVLSAVGVRVSVPAPLFLKTPPEPSRLPVSVCALAEENSKVPALMVVVPV